MNIADKKHWLMKAVHHVAPILMGSPAVEVDQRLVDKVNEMVKKVYVPLGITITAMVVQRNGGKQIELVVLEDNEEIGTSAPISASVYPTVGNSMEEDQIFAADEEPMPSNDEMLSQVLSRLLNLAQGQVQIKFNPNKDARQTIEEYMVYEAGFGGMDGDEFSEYTLDEVNELLAADTLVVVEVSGDPEVVACAHLRFYGVNLFNTLMKAIERLEAMGDDEEGELGDAEQD